MKKNIIIICFDERVSKVIAKRLADILNLFHANVDTLIDFETDSYLKLSEIKADEYYLEVEAKLIQTLSEFSNVVLSIGETNILSEKILKLIKKDFKIVFLKQTKKEFKQTNKNPEDELIFGELNKLYEGYADFTVDIKNKAEKAIAEEIAKEV